MKLINKVVTFGVFASLALGLTSCNKGWQPLADDVKSITIAASPSPHGEILTFAKPLFEAKGYSLIIKEYTDYVQPNLAVEDGDCDANYFQHTPYLTSFNEEHETHLLSVGNIHYEPYAIYKGSKQDLSDIANGDKILVPNDKTNEARALNLLAEAKLITLKTGVGLDATKLDILENKLNLDIVELEARQIAANRSDAAFAIINGNYALDAGLTSSDALQFESSTGIAATTYANILVVREGNQNNLAIKALFDVLTSEEVKNFIKDTYNGAVIAL